MCEPHIVPSQHALLTCVGPGAQVYGLKASSDSTLRTHGSANSCCRREAGRWKVVEPLLTTADVWLVLYRPMVSVPTRCSWTPRDNM